MIILVHLPSERARILYHFSLTKMYHHSDPKVCVPEPVCLWQGFVVYFVNSKLKVRLLSSLPAWWSSSPLLLRNLNSITFWEQKEKLRSRPNVLVLKLGGLSQSPKERKLRFRPINRLIGGPLFGWLSHGLLNRWTSQFDLGITTEGLERVVSVHNST